MKHNGISPLSSSLFLAICFAFIFSAATFCAMFRLNIPLTSTVNCSTNVFICEYLLCCSSLMMEFSIKKAMFHPVEAY